MSTASNIELDRRGPVPEPHYDLLDASVEYAKNPYKFGKAVSTFIKLFDQVGWVPSDYSDGVRAVGTAGTLVKTIGAPAKLLKAVNSFRNEVADYLDPSHPEARNREKSVDKWSISVAAAGIVPPIYEGGEFFTKAVYFIPKSSIQALTGIAGACITWINFKGAYDSIKILEAYNKEGKNPVKATRAFIKITAQLSYIALGILLVLANFFSFIFAPLAFTLLSTVCVISSLVENYYVHLVENPLKNKVKL